MPALARKILVDDNSPCFNLEFARLGSAPPYRSGQMMATETMLPKLKDHWTPSDSRVKKEDQLSKTISYKYKNINKTIKSTDINKSPRVGGEKNNTKTSFGMIKTLDRRKSATGSNIILDKTLQATGNHTKDTHRNIKHIDMHDGIQFSRTRLKDTKVLPSDKLCLNTYEKLKVCGVALNSKDTPTTKQQSYKRKQRPMNAKEIISPLLNSLYTDNPQFYYRKKYSLQSSVSSHKPPISSSRMLPDNAGKSYKTEDKKASIMTIKEYLKLENARYAHDERTVKRILFDNWLHNIELQPYMEDETKTPVSEESNSIDGSQSSSS